MTKEEIRGQCKLSSGYRYGVSGMDGLSIPTIRCARCQTLVPEGYFSAHTDWHVQLEAKEPEPSRLRQMVIETGINAAGKLSREDAFVAAATVVLMTAIQKVKVISPTSTVILEDLMKELG